MIAEHHGLTGMAQAFAELQASGDAADLSHADWLGPPSVDDTLTLTPAQLALRTRPVTAALR